MDLDVKYFSVESVLIKNSQELPYQGDLVNIGNTYLVNGKFSKVSFDYNTPATFTYACINGNSSSNVHCENVTIENPATPIGLSNCMNVRYCRSNALTKYSGCYSGALQEAAYSADGTLNGGWNQ